MSSLPTPNSPICEHLTFHSLQLHWEDALEQANEVMASKTADDRVKVILEQQAVGWSDSWDLLYTGFAGGYDIDGLSPQTAYTFRIRFMSSTAELTAWSPEVTFTTHREPMYSDTIHKAILMQDFEKLRHILALREANINGMDRFGYTPLMRTACDGSLEMVKIILEFGADVDYKNDISKTALMMAAFSGHLDVVKLLRANKASYELRDIGGVTALHWACDSKKAQLVDWMLNDGANVDARDRNGYTPLLRVAGLNGSHEIIHVLLRHKADVNAVDNKNKSALMLATINDNDYSVQALLEAQADLSIKNKHGKTVYDMAIAMDRKSVIKVLDEYMTKNGVKIRK